MRTGPVVVIVGDCPALGLALAALEELDLRLRVIPTVVEAERALLGDARPSVSALLISLMRDSDRGLALIRSLRAKPGLGAVPIAVWARSDSNGLLREAYVSGVNSGVLLDGSDDDAISLARMVHYWAVANEPHVYETAR